MDLGWKVYKEPLKRQKGYTLRIEEERDGKIYKKYLHSIYHPQEEAKKWVDEVFDREILIYFIYGAGYLYHVMTLATLLEEKKTEAKVIVLEPMSEIEDLLQEDGRLNELDHYDNVTMISEKSEIAFRKRLNWFLGDISSRQFKLLVYPTYQEIYPEKLRRISEQIRDILMRRYLSNGTVFFMREQFLENIVRNAKFMARSTPIDGLRGAFSSKTAITVSAGPSLEKNIDVLKEYQDQFLIITGGRSLKALLNHGITPHVVCCADFDEANYKLYQAMDILGCEVPMVSTWGNNYRIVEEYQGEKIFVNDASAKDLDLQLFQCSISGLAIGLTVASLQVLVGVYMGCDTIIFIGQDLAYSNERRYGDETKKGFEGENLKQQDFFEVRGNVEEKVKTTHELNSFRVYLEDLIFLLKEDHFFINATEGGAYINGTEVMTLKEALMRYAGDHNEFFAQRIDEKMEQNRMDISKDALKQTMEGMLESGRKLFRYAEEARVLTQKLSKGGSDGQRSLQRLDQLDEKIRCIRKNVSLVDFFVQLEMDEVIRRADDVEDDQKIIENSLVLYRTLGEAARAMNRTLQQEIDFFGKL